MAIEHSLRERNKLEDFMANVVFSFADKDFISYIDFQALPREAEALLNMDKSQIPNLRINMLQKDFFFT